MTIKDIEITQAIQYFNIPEDSKYPNNSVPIVSNKGTIVRVYVENIGSSTEPVSNVTAELYGTTPLGSLGSLKPINGPITVYKAQDWEQVRGDVNRTLNFLLPSGPWQTGRVVLKAIVNPDGKIKETNPNNNECLKVMDFNDTGSLDIVFVLVHYTWNGFDDTPNIEHFLKWGSIDFLMKTYPINQVRLWGLDGSRVLPFDKCDLYDTDIEKNHWCWSKLWGALVNKAKKSNDVPTDGRWYGIVPVPLGIVITSGQVRGLGLDTTPYAAVGQNLPLIGVPLMAHEIGHTFGRDHPWEDDDYPKESKYEGGLIGEYGYDVWDNSILDKRETYDFMSYEYDVWVSPYTYKGLFSKLAQVSQKFSIYRQDQEDLERLSQNSLVTDLCKSY